jgi:hypothetical protein
MVEEHCKGRLLLSWRPESREVERRGERSEREKEKEKERYIERDKEREIKREAILLKGMASIT